jgi:hypothetical protein
MFRWVGLAVLCAVPSLAADLVFLGNLERVGHGSISIKLADLREIDARIPDKSNLTAAKLAAAYKMGDHVQISCKKIRSEWEEESGRFQFLELTKLRRLRNATAADVARISVYPPWSNPVNLLSRATQPPSPMLASTDAALEHARQINLEFAQHMPNFMADETAKRYTADANAQEWRDLDTIETEITFKGSRAVRRQIRRDGKPWEEPFQALPGFKWSGGFGSEIRPLFDPRCPTAIRFVETTAMRGREVREYEFQSPPDGCFDPFYLEYQRYNPARSGHVFIEESGHIVQLDELADDFPRGMGFAERQEEVFLDYVKIGDSSRLVPVGANFVVRYAGGNRARVEVEYKNHRHFEASTNVTFR